MNTFTKFLLAGAAMVVLPGIAYAQTPPEPAVDNSVDELVITAQRREEKLMDVPLTVDAASGEKLEAIGVTQTTELSRMTPGLQFTQNGNVAQPSIRGVATKNSSPGDSPNVALYVDGVYIASQYGGFIDFNNVARVEVLKGPQGTLYGRNATGGAINIVTRNPDDVFEVNGELGIFSYNGWEGQIYANAPIAEGLAANFAASFTRDDGYIKDIVTGKNLISADNYSFRTKLLWEPTDALSVTLALDYSKHNTSTGYANIPVDGNASAVRTAGAIIGERRGEVALSFIPYAKNRNAGAAVTVAYDFQPFTLTSITSARINKNSSLTDNDMSNLPQNSLRFGGPTHTYTQEFIATSNTDGPIEWLAGVFWISDKAQRKLHKAQSGATTSRTYATAETDAISPYFEVTWHTTEQLSFIGGMRYNYEEKSLRNRSNNTIRLSCKNTAPPAAKCAEQDWESTTYRLTARYEIDDELNVYLTNSTGFKSGVYNTTAFDGTPVDPETITAWAVGMKSSKFGVDITAEVFNYDYKDLQVLRSLDPITGTSLLQNASNAKISGAEILISDRINGNWRYNIGVAYLDAKYEDFTGASVLVPRSAAACGAAPYPCGNIDTPSDVSGNPLIRAPEWTANASLTYETELWGGEADVTGSLYYTSEFAWDVGNRVKQPSYTLLRLEASWSPTPDSPWKITLWGDNLTDEEYFANVNTSTSGDTGIYAAPRRFGAKVGFKFQ
ncbi:MAG: TonB-dependent receptor [Caulobacter sp.]|nr:TonB-dependent receptor [Caulobacter sp.]